jgi:hypothetical protein
MRADPAETLEGSDQSRLTLPTLYGTLSQDIRHWGAQADEEGTRYSRLAIKC